MAEGVIDSGARVDVGVGDRRKPPQPPADPERAPHGWTWDAKAGHWRPKKRPGRGGRVKPVEDDQAAVDEGPADSETGDPSPGWQAERDPDPARLREGTDTKRPTLVREVPQDVKDDLAAVIGMLGMVVLTPIAQADPICGGALVANWQNTVEASVPLIARSERVVGWMTTAGGLRDWIGLGVALQPVVSAVWAHHVTKTVHIEHDPDSEQPVVRQEDWSAYPAA